METDQKLERAIELIESLIMDFEKLKPFIGDAAFMTAQLYRENLKQITENTDK